MSKSREYTFYKSKELYDWGGNVISRNLCDKLRPGDVVRLCLDFKGNGWYKYYFEITKIDYYKYGNTSKPRKFYGKVLDTYIMNWYVIDENHKTSFRKEDIIEIPGWKSEFNPLAKQRNFDIIDKAKLQICRQQSEYDEWAYCMKF